MSINNNYSLKEELRLQQEYNKICTEACLIKSEIEKQQYFLRLLEAKAVIADHEYNEYRKLNPEFHKPSWG